MRHRFYPIIDLDFSGQSPAVETARALGTAGCSMIEVRAKTATGAQYFAFARKVMVAAGPGCRVVVNDRLDVALASGAAGVHLGEHDIPVAEARKLAGAGFIVGATSRDPETAVRAAGDGADYIGAGAVFPTSHKHDTRLIGLEGLAAVARAVDIPVFAIAGITAANCARVVETGAWGVSGIGCVAGADDPAGAWLAIERVMSTAAGQKR
ncbi:MAG: thiamine phosphate synthase [Candidatus Glassbacteria bacterium]|nr:thiamine phosphate synthase [Candidatus Glassbacteria bacterium]